MGRKWLRKLKATIFLVEEKEEMVGMVMGMVMGVAMGMVMGVAMVMVVVQSRVAFQLDANG